MQQAGEDAAGIEPVAGQDLGNGQRMGDVGVAIVAQLPGVGIGGQHVGGVDERGIGARIIGRDPARQFPLTRGERQCAEDFGDALGGRRAIRRERRGGQAVDGVFPSSRHHPRLSPAAAAEFGFDRRLKIGQRGVVAA